MPRNMSFMLTTEQFRNRTKTVTRRNGWKFLKPGDIVCAVEKSQGLKRGETVKRLGLIRIVSVRREPLNHITKQDCIDEGFPDWSPQQFVRFYADHNRIDIWEPVTRIEFEYIDESEGA